MPSSGGLSSHQLRTWGRVLAIFAGALWIELALNRFDLNVRFIAFAPAIALAAWLGGSVPALVLTVLSVLATDYFLLGPGVLFTFGTLPEGAATVLFAAAWAGIAMLVGAVTRRVEQDAQARADAQRAETQALRAAQTTAALGQVLTSADAIEAAIQEALHWLGGNAGLVFELSEDARHMTVARAVGYKVEAGESWDLESFGENSPVAEAIQRTAPIIVKPSERARAEYKQWAALGPWRDQVEMLILPIVVERRVIAMLQIDYAAEHEFTIDDHEYIHMLCSRTAQALGRTRWYEAVEQARVDAEGLKTRADAQLVEHRKTEQALRASETRYRALATRTTRLHALTASLSVAASVTAVAKAIVEQARVVVGANDGDLYLADTDASRLEPGMCATEALTMRQPVFVGSLAESQEKYWRSASNAADDGFASIASLPLIVSNIPIGVLDFHFSAPVNFDEEFQALLVSVAQYCAQALERARLYEQAQRARADAEAANRLKDEFVSTVSHELRTPLNAILGWSSMLRTNTIDPGVVPQAVDSIHRNASRQAKLVDDLLDFSRMTSGRVTLDFETVEAHALIRGIVESVIPLGAASQIDVQLSEIPHATLRGDVRRLEQVFVNLLGNALKFTPSGGHVMVSGRIVGRQMEIRVADDGIGIEPEFLPHVFDRFRQGDSTTTRNHPGLGLGLSIAKQLVEAHRGSIRVESGGKGRGTAFIVTLPLSGEVADVARDSQPAPDEPRLDGIRVLVVDDEKDAQELIGRVLEERGAKIAVADNSTMAIEILEHDDIDVVLADIAMPGEDGYSLIRRIRSAGTKLASIPAAAVTAHARDDERRRALAAGFHVHVAKPVEPLELVRAVNHLLHDRRAAPRSSA